jgi:hypothetical protein
MNLKGRDFLTVLDYTEEEINNLRRYGLLCNGPDFTFTDERGFVINGSRNLLRKNIFIMHVMKFLKLEML